MECITAAGRHIIAATKRWEEPPDAPIAATGYRARAGRRQRADRPPPLPGRRRRARGGPARRPSRSRVEPSMRIPGAGFSPYGQPSAHESKVGRIFASAPGTTGTGASRTPLHLLDGMITPERAALRAPPRRHSRHRSGRPPAADPRPGAASADLHSRRADELPDGIAHHVSRMRRQRPAAQPEGARTGQRAGPAGPRLLRGVDGRAPRRSAAGGRRRPEGAVDPRRGRRRRRHEPQRTARQGDGRRADRARPERRAGAAVERLSDAPAAAGLRGQHERQMAAPDQADRRSDHDQGRDLEIHAARRGRQRRCNSSSRWRRSR